MKRTLTCAMVLGIAAAALPSLAAAPAANPPQHLGQVQGQSYLGVDLRDITEDEVAPLKLKDAHGAEIILVDHDAPAGKAGLREHDVVLQMNGHPITGQDQMRHMLHDCPAGRTLVLLISRDGQQMTVTATTSTREEVERQAWAQHISTSDAQDPSPGNDGALAGASPAATSTPPSVRAGNSFMGSLLMNSSYTGAMLEQMSSQLAAYFGATTGGGLLVRSIVDNSPAAVAGMRAGDVVIRANERPITTTSDWAKVIKNGHGHPLSVVVLRDKRERTLTLTPDPKHRSSLEELFVSPERTVMAYLNRSRLP